MNLVCISGNLCTEPDFRKTQNGISQCTVRLGVARDYKDNSSGRRETDFISVVTWRQSADFLAQHAHKGDTVLVRGNLQTRNYEKDGVRHYITEISADRVELFKKRERDNNAAASEELTEVPNDGLPF